MKLFSNDFKHEEMIPAKFCCDGKDISPHLTWKEVPPDTQSFALIVDDPDAPMGTWIHWLMCDIPKEIRELKQGNVPSSATQVSNDFGKLDYGGPCPPSGTHRYFFKLYALKVKKLPDPKKDDFYEKVEKHAIEKAVLMGKYKGQNKR